MHAWEYVRVIVCSFLLFANKSGSNVSSVALKHEGSAVLLDQLTVDRLGLV